ncbi:hypothetical protein AOLI_G00278450 [Acnodon oligacanthus]
MVEKKHTQKRKEEEYGKKTHATEVHFGSLEEDLERGVRLLWQIFKFLQSTSGKEAEALNSIQHSLSAPRANPAQQPSIPSAAGPTVPRPAPENGTEKLKEGE